MEDHTLLPGVETGDIGPKIGYNIQHHSLKSMLTITKEAHRPATNNMSTDIDVTESFPTVIAIDTGQTNDTSAPAPLDVDLEVAENQNEDEDHARTLCLGNIFKCLVLVSAILGIIACFAIKK